MGQYYKPILLEEKSGENEVIKCWMYSHEYNNGLKLMEHSWLGNEFVTTFESLLAETPQRVVWAGDYADTEPNQKYYVEDKEYDANLYSLCDQTKKVNPNKQSKIYRYLINHSKGVYVDKNKIPVGDTWTDHKTNKTYSSQIHPLPLLTCEGNGNGGGDYRGDSDIVGTWARDIISVSTKKPKGLKEIAFTLVEY
jgi:hypothetical protein